MADRDDEIIRLRDRMHRAENRLTAHALDHEVLKAVEQRLTAIERALARQDGAVSLAGSFLKSPFVGWLAGAAIALWAIISGKTP